jgi:hypothetical protein
MLNIPKYMEFADLGLKGILKPLAKAKPWPRILRAPDFPLSARCVRHTSVKALQSVQHFAEVYTFTWMVCTLVLSVHLYCLYTCTVCTLVQSVRLYSLYTCTVSTLVRCVHLYSLCKCTVCTVVLSVHLYCLYSCTVCTLVQYKFTVCWDRWAKAKPFVKAKSLPTILRAPDLPLSA